MKSPVILSLLSLCTMAIPFEAKAVEEKAPVVDEVPEMARGFGGVILGEVVAVDGSTLTVKVLKINKFWPKSEAKEPEALVGKTFEVRGFREEARDLLKELKPGDRIEMGAQAGRTRLEYPGEMFRRAEGEGAPRKPEEAKGDGEKEKGEKKAEN